jgi:hypothetical protein
VKLGLLLGTAAVLALAGCASVQVTTRFDPLAPFATYHRYFFWFAPRGEEKETVVTPFRGPAHEAVSRILSRKGYVESQDGQAEFLVRLLVFEESSRLREATAEMEVRLEPAGRFGERAEEGEPPADPRTATPAALPEWEPGGLGVESVDVSEVTVGCVLVQIFDVRTGTVVWWGLGKGITSPSTPGPELEAALEKTLEKFPPEVKPIVAER